MIHASPPLAIQAAAAVTGVAGFAAASVTGGGALPEVLSAAGFGGVALAVGWKLLQWADKRSVRERGEAEEAHEQTRSDLGRERIAHQETREALTRLTVEVTELRVEIAILATRLENYEGDH
jgi:hypothetical protein